MINIQTVLIREQIIKSIRDFFCSQNFQEITIPALNRSIPLEPNLYPFTTAWKTRKEIQTLYLSTSPERRLKQLISLGVGNCFGIGSSFRNLENSGTFHSPEFLMLEWYRKSATYIDIMKDTRDLILYIRNSLTENNKLNINYSKNWEKISLTSLFSDYLQTDLNKIIENNDTLFKIAKKKGYNTKNTTWNELYDQLFVNEIESHLPKEPFFLIDFPSCISPLCKPKGENKNLAERFELYINGIEIANGNTEYTDTKVVKTNFVREQKKRAVNQPIDYEFLNSLKIMNDVSYAGIGLGVDRLTMLFTGSKSIDELGALM